ncbi:hypothetical protein EMCRGX_G027896 [Ephydatia muelleri]
MGQLLNTDCNQLLAIVPRATAKDQPPVAKDQPTAPPAAKDQPPAPPVAKYQPNAPPVAKYQPPAAKDQPPAPPAARINLLPLLWHRIYLLFLQASCGKSINLLWQWCNLLLLMLSLPLMLIFILSNRYILCG